MEENYEKILWEGYGLRFFGGNRIRTGYLCKTDKEIVEIRKVNIEKNHILFEHELKQHLIKKGFCHISTFLITKENLPYYVLDKDCYVAERPLETQPLDEEEKQTFIIGAKTLSKLHKSAKGLQSKQGYFSGEKRLEKYEKRRIELLKIKKRIEKQSSYTPLDLLIKQNFEYYIEKIEQAKELFHQAQYCDIMQKATIEKTVCHNAFKGENIQQDTNGVIFVTGFGKCSYDSTVVDLALYLRRLLKKQQCDIQTAEKMLCAYEQEMPLSKQDKILLLALLSYPEKFLSLCNEYYNKRRVCISPAMIERMQLCIASIEENEKLLSWLKTI